MIVHVHVSAVCEIISVIAGSPVVHTNFQIQFPLQNFGRHTYVCTNKVNETNTHT